MIPSITRIVATSIPANAKPKVTPICLMVSLTAVWLRFRTDLITLLVEISVGIDTDKDASELMDSTTIIMPANTRIPPPIIIPGPRLNFSVYCINYGYMYFEII